MILRYKGLMLYLANIHFVYFVKTQISLIAAFMPLFELLLIQI